MSSCMRLTVEQLQAFDVHRTEKGMQSHGPLNQDDIVPVHTHDEVALYLVTGGQALLFNERGEAIPLGENAEWNAVLIQPDEAHGWRALNNGITIPHVLGEASIQAVLAAA